ALCCLLTMDCGSCLGYLPSPLNETGGGDEHPAGDDMLDFWCRHHELFTVAFHSEKRLPRECRFWSSFTRLRSDMLASSLLVPLASCSLGTAKDALPPLDSHSLRGPLCHHGCAVHRGYTLEVGETSYPAIDSGKGKELPSSQADLRTQAWTHTHLGCPRAAEHLLNHASEQLHSEARAITHRDRDCISLGNTVVVLWAGDSDPPGETATPSPAVEGRERAPRSLSSQAHVGDVLHPSASLQWPPPQSVLLVALLGADCKPGLLLQQEGTRGLARRRRLLRVACCVQGRVRVSVGGPGYCHRALQKSSGTKATRVSGPVPVFVLLGGGMLAGHRSRRILNRFSKDIGHMDDLLPLTFLDFLQVTEDFVDGSGRLLRAGNTAQCGRPDICRGSAVECKSLETGVAEKFYSEQNEWDNTRLSCVPRMACAGTCVTSSPPGAPHPGRRAPGVTDELRSPLALCILGLARPPGPNRHLGFPGGAMSPDGALSRVRCPSAACPVHVVAPAPAGTRLRCPHSLLQFMAPSSPRVGCDSSTKLAHQSKQSGELGGRLPGSSGMSRVLAVGDQHWQCDLCKRRRRPSIQLQSCTRTGGSPGELACPQGDPNAERAAWREGLPTSGWREGPVHECCLIVIDTITTQILQLLYQGQTLAPMGELSNVPQEPHCLYGARRLVIAGSDTFLLVVGVVGVAVAVIPWIAIPLVPLGIIFFVLRRYFLETSRDVKRLESTTRSPVFSHLSSSLQGLWVIRAFKAEERFQELFDAHQDLHSEAWFLFLTTSRWFAVRLDAICAIFVIVVAFGSLILAKTLDAGQVGLALSYALTLMGMFQWCVRQSAEVENMMISVERVIEYTDLEKEAPWECEKRPPPGWPHEGVIVFDNVNFSYSLDGPLVLKHLTALIKSREKVGIVGRTGAGKSSLISALFRLSEPEGKIWIDKILTTEIGLHDLRKNMSIIPQEPVLFTGTMRKNLDPFNEHADEELWNALKEVQLKDAIEDLPGKMDTELAESGSNFSVGQRQLVCLARAILRKNRILIIDEATANVDPRTDELIQKKIREKFAHCTVLTIAHRLNTIIDSDKIMVLDSGRLKEYDEPYILLQNPESLFYKMVQQLGKAEAAALLETAKQVSAPAGAVIIAGLHRVPLAIWHREGSNEHPEPFSITSFQRQLRDWRLTTRPRSKAVLLQSAEGAGRVPAQVCKQVSHGQEGDMPSTTEAVSSVPATQSMSLGRPRVAGAHGNRYIWAS
ncbi:Multidrug resistance-associated protein 4, partial [Galemys pyrenaicus]